MGKGEEVRKFLLFAGLVTALAIPAVAISADLNPGQIGQGCTPGNIGTFHFVLNQHTGTTEETLTVNFSTGAVKTATPYMVVANGKVQHFSVSGSGTVTGASTTGDGWLVISDFSCKKKHA
jgi:hypothetical protein